MFNKHFRLIIPTAILLIASLACSVLPGGGSASSIQATANAALTQADIGVATASAEGNSLQATANAASTQLLATANAAGGAQSTAAPTASAIATSTTAAGGNNSGSPKDIPLIDPHTVISASDHELTYSTTADIQTVAKFYQDQMPKLGWAAQVKPYISASVAKMDFIKADSIASIGISIDPKTKQTTVGVIIE